MTVDSTDDIQLDVSRVLSEGSLRIAFQPIVTLSSRAVIGCEALARFPTHPGLSPTAWFAAAYVRGLGVALELAAMREAILLLDQLPAGAFISINLSPLAAASPRASALLSSVDARRVVLEIKEDATEEAYNRFSAVFDQLRATGVRIAVDEAGMAAVDLRHILNVSPFLVKIDDCITRGISHDPFKQALAAALASLAKRSGALSVAEEIETEEELATLQEVGVLAGQGYLFGRPAFLSGVADSPPPPEDQQP